MGRIIKPGQGEHLWDDVRNLTGSPKGASQWLRARGISGVVYLDQQSREADDKLTRNYVVFDARRVRVVGKTYPRNKLAGEAQT